MIAILTRSPKSLSSALKKNVVCIGLTIGFFNSDDFGCFEFFWQWPAESMLPVRGLMILLCKADFSSRATKGSWSLAD